MDKEKNGGKDEEKEVLTKDTKGYTTTNQEGEGAQGRAGHFLCSLNIIFKIINKQIKK